MFDINFKEMNNTLYGSQPAFTIDLNEDQESFFELNGIRVEKITIVNPDQCTVKIYSQLLNKSFNVNTKDCPTTFLYDLKNSMNNELENELNNKLILGHVDILSRNKNEFKIGAVRKVDEQSIIQCGSNYNECLVGLYKECTLKRFNFGVDMPDITCRKLENGMYRVFAHYLINGEKISATGPTIENCFNQLAFSIAKNENVVLDMEDPTPYSTEPNKEEGYEDVEELEQHIDDAIRSIVASQYVDARLLAMAMTDFEKGIMCLNKAIKVGARDNES